MAQNIRNKLKIWFMYDTRSCNIDTCVLTRVGD